MNLIFYHQAEGEASNEGVFNGDSRKVDSTNMASEYITPQLKYLEYLVETYIMASEYK
jgi:hypothetical protein